MLRKLTSKDVEYYDIYDLSETPDKYGYIPRFGADFTIKEAKIWINQVNQKVKEIQ